MNTVLVTGGAGYIGSHAAKALSRAGYRPVVLDDLSKGHEWAVKWGPFERGSTHDRGVLEWVFEQYRPSAVMHFAAFIEVGESVVDPGKYYFNNVGGALSLIAAACAHGIDKFVFSSTCAVHGLPTRIPITEDLPTEPINPYGRSKLMVEQMLADYGRAHGLRSAVLRYFNACGADPDGELGEDHDPESHLIPRALAAALGRGERLKLFGDDYDTPDGTCIRDYIHVVDLAEAHVTALRHLEAGGASVTLNLGTGIGLSVREIIDAVGRATGSSVPHDVAPRRPGDPPRLVADPSRAAEVLGWRARCSDIDTIITSALRWARRGEA